MASLETLLGGSPALFLGLTLVLFGAASWAMGAALADGWRPRWQIYPYAVLLAAADRFLAYALFGERLLSIWAFALAAAVLAGIALLAFQLTFAAKMVQQYPWLYERSGAFGVRPRAG